MPQTFQLSNFTGPLDLLLSLVEDKKKDISEVAISEVTDTFLQYLEQMADNHDGQELADFLIVAARLLYLKSRALMPAFLPPDMEDSGAHLADQLRVYQKFVAASRTLHENWLDKKLSVYRNEPVRIIIPEGLPENVTVESLHNACERLIKRLRPPKPLPTTTIDRSVSIKEKIQHLRNLLARGTFNLLDAVSSRENRTELIVSFLALLELVKTRVVAIEQTEQFGDIVVNKV
jgi:segregation and condensation protein A